MKRIISISILISFSIFSYAQANIDSLVSLLSKKQRDTARAMTYFRIAIAYSHSDPDEGMVYAQKGLEFTEKKKFTSGTAAANAALGICLHAKKKFTEATNFLERSLELYRGINDVIGQGYVITAMADNYNSAGEYQQALELYFQSYRFKEVQRDSLAMAIALQNAATVYFNLDQKKACAEQLNKALMLLKSINNKKELAHCYYSIAILLKNDHYECDSAIFFLRRATTLLDEIGEERNALEFKNVLSKKLYECASKADGKKLAEEVLAKAIEKKYQLAMADAYGNLAMMYNDDGNFAKGLEHGTKALEMAKQLHEHDRFMNLYESLERSYHGLNDLKNAYTYLELYTQTKDSLRNDSTTKHFLNMQARYESEKKDKEQIASEAAKNKMDAEANEGSLKRNTFLILIVLVALLAFFILKGYRVKRELNNKVSAQQMIIEDKNLEIMDSITNAKSLQDAILPPHTFMKQYFPESFIFFRPKDVVAGDFYWMEVIGEYIYLAVADCTGQGVPGAMVSVVCSNALSRSVKEFAISDTGKILDKVSVLVLETFKKRERDVRDGMDISLIRFNKNSGAAQWSGANNSLWYIRNKELIEVMADKQTIGKSEKEHPFTTHELNFQKNDSVFLFTDGYADQFSEEKGKKFKYSNMKTLLLSIAERKLPEQKLIIDARLENWKGNLEQVDDILIVGVRV